MKAPSVLVALLFGTGLGAGLVVACSDDSPTDVDAAVCDCPAAEPPLTGRIVVQSDTISVTPGVSTRGAFCPVGATLLGGGCRLDVADTLIDLAQAGADRTLPTQPGYGCYWNSTSGMTRTGTAEAICLLPAPQ